MPSPFLHGLAKLFSFGRKPASRIEDFPVYRPEMPKVGSHVDADATKRVFDDALHPSPDGRPADRGTGSDVTQRLPWPARDAHAGRDAAPSRRTDPARPHLAGGDDATTLVGHTEADPSSPGDQPRRGTSDATVLVTARKRPPK